jgi:flagellar biosynthesis chaperone FliJ
MDKVESAKWEAQRPADRTMEKFMVKKEEIERSRIALSKVINELEFKRDQLDAIIQQQKTKIRQLKDDNNSKSLSLCASSEYNDNVFSF